MVNYLLLNNSDLKVKRGSAQVGGIVGSLDWGYVNNCENYGNITLSSSEVGEIGGIIGYIEKGIDKRIENNYYLGKG